ncbi:MAG: hypothetical protein GXO22_02910 [Aquificae bacterium]|nr:hypothetical protein [Aquificota bacterium]
MIASIGIASLSYRINEYFSLFANLSLKLPSSLILLTVILGVPSFLRAKADIYPISTLPTSID